MNTTVDGQFQRYSVESGEYIRDHFFGPDPRLREMVAHLTDDELRNLPRGGHDYRKLYAAYKAATENLGSGAPTVILCKTIKGWTLGEGFEGRNATHQIKKMTKDQLVALRDRLYLHDEIPEDSIHADDPPYYIPPRGLRRVPVHDGAPPGARRVDPQAHDQGPPPAGAADRQAVRRAARRVGQPGGVARRWASPACCATWPATSTSAPRVVPIIPDEARTFGMDALFRELKIYAALGQKYEPVDHDLLLSYTESSQRPDPRGGHHRGRLAGQLHRRRHQLRPPRRADGALLHVLFDVRLPARRRPHLAGGRRPGPRLPARRHRRPHDAARRGPPAPGRPQPRAGQHGAAGAGLRPGVRLRGGDHRAGRAAPDVRPGHAARASATSSTTSRSTTRTT